MGQEGILYLFGRSQCIWNVLGSAMKAFGKCMGRLLLHLVFVCVVYTGMFSLIIIYSKLISVVAFRFSQFHNDIGPPSLTAFVTFQQLCCKSIWMGWIWSGSTALWEKPISVILDKVYLFDLADILFPWYMYMFGLDILTSDGICIAQV